MYRTTIVAFFLLSVFTLNSCGVARSDGMLPFVATKTVEEDYVVFSDLYEYINHLRQSAGLSALNKNDNLQTAAENHLRYLKNNSRYSHEEDAALDEYTGENASARALAAGYSTRFVFEGIATGDGDMIAVDNLMSAIYHRLNLFNLDLDSIGISSSELRKNKTLVVHNMGNSKINTLCKTTEEHRVSFEGYCASGATIDSAEVMQAVVSTRQKNNSIVVWPAENAFDIPPVFYEEDPDPLPEHSVSGYPVTVQFNRVAYASVSVTAFRLYDLVDDVYIESTLQLDTNNDPNKLLSSHEFALFPLQRLEWNRRYRVELEYIADGIAGSMDWVFRTRSLQGNIVRLSSNQDTVKVERGKVTYLYLIPSNANDVIDNISSMRPANMQLNVSAKDKNTLVIEVAGTTGTAKIIINNGRELSLTVI
ncbi:MAG: CAP domain-containing protein [Gammaproteobacteria bacterium]|nr:CAP domain-containing protein [Gammaproteobacteria bacterium]